MSFLEKTSQNIPKASKEIAPVAEAKGWEIYFQPALLLRVAIAFVFLYAAIAAFIDPSSWIGFVPEWMRSLIPENLFLLTFNSYQIILALWLLSGKRIFWAAIIATLNLAAIVILNLGSFDLVFRDVGLALAAGALAVMSKGKKL